MDKPTALTNAELDDLALRVKKGWVVRYDQMRALIAMARERNDLVAAQATAAAAPSAYACFLSRPTLDPHSLCGND